MKICIRPLILSLFVLLFMGGAFSQEQFLQKKLWVPNGQVYTMARSGNTIYMGGDFTALGPSTGGCLLTNSLNGTIDTRFPTVNGTVSAITDDGAGGWIIGGGFTKVGNVDISYLARIKSDFTVDATWDPKPNASVTDITRGTSTIFIAGTFTSIGTNGRTRIAELNISTGIVTSFNPAPDNTVYCLTYDQAPGVLYVGGKFTTISGTARNRIAAYTSGGTLKSWNPGASSYVYAITVNGSNVYVGGSFTTIAGVTRNRAACIDATTAVANSWNPNAYGGTIYSIALGEDYIGNETVYLGGSFSTIGGITRSNLACVDVPTGALTSWNPLVNGSVYVVQSRGALVYIAGTFSVAGNAQRMSVAAIDNYYGQATNYNPRVNEAVNAFYFNDAGVLIGGNFTGVAEVYRHGLAAIDIQTGEATDWDPNVTGTVYTSRFDGSTLYVGGEFQNVGGESRKNLAAINASTGAAMPWNPISDGNVWAIDISGATVYIGGGFNSVSGFPRNHIAAIDKNTGGVTSFDPSANLDVMSIVVSGSLLYAGGMFDYIGSTPRNYLAAINTVTGIPTSWDPNPDAPVLSLTVSGSLIYTGGSFYTIGSSERHHLAAIDQVSGIPTSWDPSPNSDVNAIAISGNTVYLGGFFSQVGGINRSLLASVDATTGAVQNFSPNPKSSNIYSILIDGQMVYFGGYFQNVYGIRCSNFAAVQDTGMSLTGTNAMLFRTFTSATLQLTANQKVATKTGIPNTANVIQEIYKRVPTAVLMVGKPAQINAALKLKCYVYPKNYKDVLNTFNKTGYVHTAVARGLDVDKKMTVLTKRLMTLPPVTHNNVLLADLMALQVNIASSDTGVTPNGFGDLIYDEGSNNPLSSKTVDEIAQYASNLMTNWEYNPLSIYENLDTTVRKINEAFSVSGPFGSSDYDVPKWTTTGRLTMYGAKKLGTVTFLKSGTATFRFIATGSETDFLPSTYKLYQNYPNPFNPSTTIEFELGTTSLVTLKIYNLLGQEIATLLDREELYEGVREVQFNARSLASGVYFYRLVAEGIADQDDGTSPMNFVETKKMILVK